jgi:hypothetical protein
MIQFKKGEDGLFSARIGDLEVCISPDGGCAEVRVHGVEHEAPCDYGETCPSADTVERDSSLCWNCPHTVAIEAAQSHFMTGYASIEECETTLRDLFKRNWDGLAFDHETDWPQDARERFATEVWSGIH